MKLGETIHLKEITFIAYEKDFQTGELSLNQNIPGKNLGAKIKDYPVSHPASLVLNGRLRAISEVMLIQNEPKKVSNDYPDKCVGLLKIRQIEGGLKPENYSIVIPKGFLGMIQ